MNADLWSLVLACALIGANAFFVGAEFSLISSRRDRLENLLEQGNPRAANVLVATEHLSMNLAGAQFGITLASLVLGKVGEPAVAHLIETPFHWLGIPEQLLHPIGFIVALLIVSVLHIILGEMVAKNIALAGPEGVAMVLIPAHSLFVTVTRPIIVFFNWVARITLRLFGIEQKDELDTTISPAELATMISESRHEGLLDAEEHTRLTKALATSRRSLREVLIDSADVRTVPMRGSGPTLGDVQDAVRDTGYSRFPVTGRDGAYVGYIHVKDILERDIADEPPSTILSRSDIRPLIAFAPDTPLDEALRAMRGRSRHIAQIVDGGHQLGIVTMEDVIEEYVGTVRDGTHDEPAR